MRFGLKDKKVENIIMVLSRYKDVKRAVIFGSRASGDFKYNSDIDIAVYTENGLPTGLYLDLDEAAGIYKIDVVDMNTLQNEKLRQKIELQGIEFYVAYFT